MSEIIDIKLQVEMCLGALEAVLPFADAAGIETNCEDAYDEWEEVVEALYSSFVVRPICDSGIFWGIWQFHRLGFEIDDEARAVVFVDIDSSTYFIFDITKFEDNHMRLVLCPLDPSADEIIAATDNCENFRVELVPNR
jgi:hypothetical protein